MTDELIVDDTGPVATFAFNRPAARNSLTLAMLTGLAEGLQRCAARDDLRAVVLRGAGELPFSAGYNLEQIQDHPWSADDARRLHAPIRAVADAIRACPHPVIGAARKFVFGAALDIYGHCDLRVCAAGTTFSMPPNRFGFLYPAEGVRALAQAIGLAHATEMLLLGQPVTTEAAAQWGLAQRVFPQNAFESGLEEIRDVVAGNAPLSMRATKRILRGDPARDGDDERDRLERAYADIAACMNSADVREAMTAFREKRTPRFQGR